MQPLRVLLMWVVVCGAMAPQQPGQPASEAELAALVEKQFGPGFKIEFVREPRTGFRYLNPPKELIEWKAVHFGDLNNDGFEDAVILALSEAPLVDQDAYNYKVMDPYFQAHGWGDPKITANFQSEDPRFANQAILVIHGSGDQAWRADTPLAKFVMINIPYKHVLVKKALVKKKKTEWAIAILEEDQLSSSLLWDGKKYRWQATGSAR